MALAPPTSLDSAMLRDIAALNDPANALQQEAERQRLMIQNISTMSSPALDWIAQHDAMQDQIRRLTSLAEATAATTAIMRIWTASPKVFDAANACSYLAPYSALQRASGAFLDHLASDLGSITGYSSILKFSPVALPNLASLSFITTLDPDDVEIDEIAETLETAKSLVSLDRQALVEQLSRIHSRIPVCMEGAWDAVARRPSERTAQCSISLRRAVDFALDTLAPIDAVRSWVTNAKKRCRPDGNTPTRRTRYEFVFRNLPGGQLAARMFHADTITCERIYQQLCSSCHISTDELDDVRLGALVSSVETMLIGFAQVQFGGIS